MTPDQIALQLYTVRELLATDLAGTLHAVADAGYRAVELASLPPTSPGELGRLLADAGLRPIASHESIEDLRVDAAAVADRLADLGCPQVVVPWMPPADRATGDDVRRFANDLNRFAAVVARRGLRLAYHNHEFEFDALDGTTTWDLLLERLAPEVELELDVYWVAFAGRDPVGLIAATAGRLRCLHMKDLGADPEPHDAPAGSGTLDFPAIVAAGRAAGVDWYIAEQDEPVAPLDDIRRAYRYLASLTD
jgi:sugar phosphate isomerase/epimerase